MKKIFKIHVINDPKFVKRGLRDCKFNVYVIRSYLL